MIKKILNKMRLPCSQNLRTQKDQKIQNHLLRNPKKKSSLSESDEQPSASKTGKSQVSNSRLTVRSDSDSLYDSKDIDSAESDSETSSSDVPTPKTKPATRKGTTNTKQIYISDSD